jgi:hypothetical protein
MRGACRVTFFCGLHQPSDAKHVSPSFVSVNRLRDRISDFAVEQWIMDSGAFSELFRHGKYRHSVEEYAAQIKRWKSCGNLLAAVSQDYMCEPFILKKTGLKTGLTLQEHQRLTIERYDALIAENTGVYIMPVLQGYTVDDYLQHVAMYGDRLRHGAWVGVGSVCKRNANPCEIFDILYAIKQLRPDLLLHGFGLKLTALSSSAIRYLLHTADSMAWSFAARKNGRNGNDWREALKFLRRIQMNVPQMHLIECVA